MPQEHRAQFQFGIASLMLVMTLVAVLFGVGAMAPGLGIALGVLAAPALIRTSVVAARAGARGEPMAPSRKIDLFVASLFVVGVVAVAAGAAFVVTCFPLGFAAFGLQSMPLVILAWLVGIAAGVAVAVLLLRFFWRRKRPRPPMQNP
jgi:hypothetical protein